MSTVIKVDSLWKRYGLPFRPMMNRAYARLAKRQYDPDRNEKWSLRDMNLDIQQGETLGIIGRNGAGKSTLLKVLAGVTPPTRGRVEIRGSLFPMIELNAGIHTELTGRENVYLLGAIMGFTRWQIHEKMKQIEEFCELDDWFDQPAWKYSSGMLARLGFGVAMNVDAEILLVDEVLAVGDLAFQRKCYSRVQELNDSGATVLLVSHNIRQVERLCEKTMWLEKGVVQMIDQSSKVAHAYYTQTNSQDLQRIRGASVPTFNTSGDLFVDQVDILDADGNRTDNIVSGESARFVLNIRTTHAIKKPIVTVGFVSTDMIVISAFSNANEVDRPSFDGKGTLEVRLQSLPLTPGIYTIRIKVVDEAGATLFSSFNMETFQIVDADDHAEELLAYAGFIRLHAEWMD